MKLSVDAYSNGASQILKSDEKEKDRNTKKAIAALDAIMDLAKSQESADTAKMLKAADMVAGFVKEANKNS